LTPAEQDSMLPVLAQRCRKENAESKQLLMQSLVDLDPIRRTTRPDL
jgi:hypothetical protein